jgi:hypothetical protein
MIRKKWMSLSLLGLVSALCLSAQSYPDSQNRSTTVPGQTQQPPVVQQPTRPATRADCAQLTADEQDFANQLNPMNKMMFCGKFTSAMRRTSMDRAGQTGSDGMLITNDQSVEQVAKDNNMALPMSPGTRQSGSCPAK